MKLFLNKIVFYILIVILYLFVNLFINLYNEINPNIKGKNIIFIGDSHMRNCINPDSFYHSINCGLNADPLIGQKWKLTQIFKIHQIDTVVISLGYHNFLDSMEIFFNSEGSKADENLHRYNLINGNELYKLNFNKKKYLLSVFRKMQKPIDLPYIGSYYSENITMQDSAKSAIHRRLVKDTLFKFTNVLVINEIRELCKKNATKCFFIFTPTAKAYNSRIPAILKRKVDDFVNELRNSGEYIDVNRNFNDSLFYDGDHLNLNGSKIFTHLVKVKLYKKQENID
jgi:hypothetical protein